MMGVACNSRRFIMQIPNGNGASHAYSVKLERTACDTLKPKAIC